MRLAAFVLTLAFGGLQTVALSDCCCLSACELTPPAQADCGTCGQAAAAAPAGDCCSEPEQAPEESPGCVHVRPSSDVVSHAHDAAVDPPVPVLVLPVVEPAAPASGERVARCAFEDLHRSERGRPLYLLDSSFLI